MPSKRLHVAFDIFVNGKKPCRAGVGELGVISAGVSWVRRAASTSENAGATSEELFLDVGGLYHDAAGSNLHPHWAHVRLAPGDRVNVRIVRAASFDPASRVSVSTAADIKRGEERYLEHVGKEHGWVKRRKPRAVRKARVART